MFIVFALLASLMFVVSLVLMACPASHRPIRPGFGTINPALALAQLAGVAAIAVAILMSVILGIAGSLALFVSALVVIAWLLTRSLAITTR